MGGGGGGGARGILFYMPWDIVARGGILWCAWWDIVARGGILWCAWWDVGGARGGMSVVRVVRCWWCAWWDIGVLYVFFFGSKLLQLTLPLIALQICCTSLTANLGMNSIKLNNFWKIIYEARLINIRVTIIKGGR